MRPERASRTAEFVCLCRALEQHRPASTRILEDSYASWFLGLGARAAQRTFGAAGLLSAPLVTYIPVRHRYIDEALLAALDRGVQQVVIAGAGYDSRAYRFAPQLGGRPVFELDFPSTSRRKSRVVAKHQGQLPEAEIIRVQVDFQKESTAHALARSGFDPTMPTFFVWEGVSMYLSRAAVTQTLAQFRSLAAPGSELAMDLWYLLDAPDIMATAHRITPNLLHFLGEPIVFGMHPEDLPDFLARQGLGCLEVAGVTELSQRYIKDGRTLYPAVYLARAQLGD